MMSELLNKKVLVLDCQTTGMHPNTGHLLQIGWAIVDLMQPDELSIEKWTLKLPDGYKIPSNIFKMLKLTREELEQSAESQDVFIRLQQAINSLGNAPVVIAHYAQFEKSFLKGFYKQHAQTEELNFNLICSQKIAKHVLPNLPSHNLKAVAGYFKWGNTPKNEILSHVAMTAHVWQQLIPKLIHEANVLSYEALSSWLNTNCVSRTPSKYEYNIERLTRLELSVKPGIYRMLAQDNSVLYVGKATSLKSRVNSYFRGVKNRDRKKLELLAQVWAIETIECDTPLEAALLESDEIKKWNPPYNLLLKSEQRRLIFYNYDFSHSSYNNDMLFINGPYKPYDAITNLIELVEALNNRAAVTYFDEVIDFDTLHTAWLDFCEQYELPLVLPEQLSVRGLLLIGFKLLRAFEQQHGMRSFQKWWAQEKKVNPQDELCLDIKLVHKISRIAIRAAEERRKSRQLKRLSHASLIIESTQKKLCLINGEFVTNDGKQDIEKQHTPLTINQYDRLSILLSALNNRTIRLE